MDALRENVKNRSTILVRPAPFPAEVERADKELKVIDRYWVDLDDVDVAAATQLGILVTCTLKINTISVADPTIRSFIATARKSVLADRNLRAGNSEVHNEFRDVDMEVPDVL